MLVYLSIEDGCIMVNDEEIKKSISFNDQQIETECSVPNNYDDVFKTVTKNYSGQFVDENENIVIPKALIYNEQKDTFEEKQLFNNNGQIEDQDGNEVSSITTINKNGKIILNTKVHSTPHFF